MTLVANMVEAEVRLLEHFVLLLMVLWHRLQGRIKAPVSYFISVEMNKAKQLIEKDLRQRDSRRIERKT
jgi:hypothetical protein